MKLFALVNMPITAFKVIIFVCSSMFSVMVVVKFRHFFKSAETELKEGQKIGPSYWGIYREVYGKQDQLRQLKVKRPVKRENKDITY